MSPTHVIIVIVNIYNRKSFLYIPGVNVKLMKKQSDSRGVIHKTDILNFIKSKSSKDWTGVHVNEIVEHVHVSRMTATNRLKDLVREDEIRKTRRGTYLPKEIFDDLLFDGWSYLEDYLTDHSSYVINDMNILDLDDLRETVTELSKNNMITMKEQQSGRGRKPDQAVAECF